ncbi:MAG: exodeoxyribonuclease VII small subunit [Bacteroidales bacterium]|nr:exodeoxyribonuclease VII small subunit [Bacteroidales bacterium]
METEKFDYKKAVDELESIAKLVEDPATGIDDIDKYIKRSEELIGQCRAYLRTAGEKISALDSQPATDLDDDDYPF